MAANKFATTLCRSTDRMTAILVYAVLEWTLILMLLLNGLFSYLIARFAAFFGLQRPCVFCARVDHLFEPAGDGRRRRGSAYCDLVCHDHAAEIAGLGYCARHRRLAEAEQMCEDCCSASSSLRPPEAALLAWMKRSEEGEKDLSCSCCGVALESGFYSPYILFKPSSGALEHEQTKGNLVEQIAVDDREDLEKDTVLFREKVEDDGCTMEREVESEEKVGAEDAAYALVPDREVEEEEEVDLIHFDDACFSVDDASLKVLSWHPWNTWDGERLVPIELIDSTTKSSVVFVHGKEDLIELEHVEGEDDKVVDIQSIAEERESVVSAAERTDIIKDSPPEHVGGGEDGAVDIQSIVEERESVVSAAEITDIIKESSSEHVGGGEDDSVVDIGSIAEKKLMLSAAEEIKESSEHAEMEQDIMDLEVRCTMEEENELVSAIEMADIVEVNPIENGVVLQEAMALHVGCDVAARDDTIENNSYEVEQTQRGVITLDMRSISEEGNELTSPEHTVDVVEDNSYEGVEAQKGAITLDLRSISEEEKALASAELMDDDAEDNSKEIDGGQQCAIILDTGNIPDEANILTSRTGEDNNLEQKSAVLPAPELTSECSSDHQFIASQATPIMTAEEDVIEAESLICEEDLPGTKDFGGVMLINLETHCEISTSSEICHQQHNEHELLQKPNLMSETQDQLSEVNNEMATMDQEAAVGETEPVEFTSQSPDHIVVFQQNNEIEEERTPGTPTHTNGIYGLNKRFLFGKRESGTESLDGSVASESEGCDTFTVDQLKAALEAERKALSSLYAELEEERSSSAIAANQTMAMITRLQEEKAAMQMEALQYQRMMEEQSEYDQEALHLLNELMMKREKEKLELEKELEMYRKRVLRYESKKRRKMTKQKANCTSGTSSTSSSAEDSDDLLFESPDKDGFSYNPDENNQNTPADDVLSSGTDQGTTKHLITLKESLADFEEERFSILEQLKALERKLITLDDEDPHSLEATEHIPDENGCVSNGHYESLSDDLQDYVNGFSDNLGASRKLHRDGRNMAYQAKRLLPLFDAMSDENEDDVCTKEEAVGASPETMCYHVDHQDKLAIAEEIDNMYERLDALEGDREFLKHCINSLKKGDKGIYLLQEILEHLRDLRRVELRARNSCNALS
ncbi:myosin-binding protein 2-like [Canna indica]|uniref:Myosin-binding protein 2-like n=1 Tax=Canna indica TaxID=4628 RepID=A0AAQ3QH85_9LILI|nr:myosin-binding protein 2-like [Canna indica]